MKNGKQISAENPLLDMEKIKQHAKDTDTFIHMVNNDTQKQYVILDVREEQQKILNKLFMLKREKNISLLEPEKLIKFQNELK